MRIKSVFASITLVTFATVAHALPLADYDTTPPDPASVTDLFNYFTDDKSDTSTYQNVTVPYEFVDTTFTTAKTAVSWSRPADSTSGTFPATVQEGDLVTYEIELTDIATGSIVSQISDVFDSADFTPQSVEFNGVTLDLTVPDTDPNFAQTTYGADDALQFSNIDPSLDTDGDDTATTIVVVMEVARNAASGPTEDFSNTVVGDDQDVSNPIASEDVTVQYIDYDFAKAVETIQRVNPVTSVLETIWDSTTGGPFPDTRDGDVVTYELTVTGQNSGTTPAQGITLYDIFEPEGFSTPPTFSNDGTGTSAYAAEDVDSDGDNEGVITWSAAEDGDTLTVSLTVAVQ